MIELQPGRDFTLSALVKYLNEKYGGKTSGKKFTRGDVQQYLLRKKLPDKYGGQELLKIVNCRIGVKLIRLK